MNPHGTPSRDPQTPTGLSEVVGVRRLSRIAVPLVRDGSGSSPAMAASHLARQSMSMPPGPMLSHPGTWEAPK
jgi:hypothetical protein